MATRNSGKWQPGPLKSSGQASELTTQGRFLNVSPTRQRERLPTFADASAAPARASLPGHGHPYSVGAYPLIPGIGPAGVVNVVTGAVRLHDFGRPPGPLPLHFRL